MPDEFINAEGNGVTEAYKDWVRPLLGDPLYGPKKMPYNISGGQLLHAFRIGFVHPRSGKEMLFEAPPEERFEHWRNKLTLKV